MTCVTENPPPGAIPADGSPKTVCVAADSQTDRAFAPHSQEQNADLLIKLPAETFRRRLDSPRLPVRITLERGLGRSRQFALSKDALRQLIDAALQLEERA